MKNDFRVTEHSGRDYRVLTLLALLEIRVTLILSTIRPTAWVQF